MERLSDKAILDGVGAAVIEGGVFLQAGAKLYKAAVGDAGLDFRQAGQCVGFLVIGGVEPGLAAFKDDGFRRDGGQGLGLGGGDLHRGIHAGEHGLLPWDGHGDGILGIAAGIDPVGVDFGNASGELLTGQGIQGDLCGHADLQGEDVQLVHLDVHGHFLLGDDGGHILGFRVVAVIGGLAILGGHSRHTAGESGHAGHAARHSGQHGVHVQGTPWAALGQATGSLGGGGGVVLENQQTVSNEDGVPGGNLAAVAVRPAGAGTFFHRQPCRIKRHVRAPRGGQSGQGAALGDHHGPLGHIVDAALNGANIAQGVFRPFRLGRRL